MRQERPSNRRADRLATLVGRRVRAFDIGINEVLETFRMPEGMALTIRNQYVPLEAVLVDQYLRGESVLRGIYECDEWPVWDGEGDIPSVSPPQVIIVDTKPEAPARKSEILLPERGVIHG